MNEPDEVHLLVINCIKDTLDEKKIWTRLELQGRSSNYFSVCSYEYRYGHLVPPKSPRQMTLRQTNIHIFVLK